MTEQSAHTLEPVVVHQDEGEARWWFAGLAVIRATAADTGGQMTIVEMTEPPGHQAPLHVHHREDEAFFILEGSATLQVGDETFDVSAGDYAFGPRDIPHRYTVGAQGCRMLFICTPGGFEKLVREMSEPAGARPSRRPPTRSRTSSGSRRSLRQTAASCSAEESGAAVDALARKRGMAARPDLLFRSCFRSWKRKALAPNDFRSLDELAERLLAFGRHYPQIARPFEWTFTRDVLDRVLEKIADREPHLRPAAKQSETFRTGRLSTSGRRPAPHAAASGRTSASALPRPRARARRRR